MDEQEKVADGSESSEEVDYKALYEEAEARADKAENDKKAALGSQKKQQERDEVIYGLHDRMEAMEKANQALIKSLTTGETDNLTGELSNIHNEAAQSRAERQFGTHYASLYEDLQAATKDDDGNVVVDLEGDSQHKDLVNEWVEAYNNKDVAGLARGLAKVQERARKAERERAKVQKQEQDKQERETKKKDADLDLGPATGAAERKKMSPTERIAQGLSKRGGLKSYQ